MTTPSPADQERLLRDLLKLNGFAVTDELVKRLLPEIGNTERTSARLRDAALDHRQEPVITFDPRTGAA
ncbi:MAG: hypothetical protein FJ039_08655 [Chloroflexi bacterium]|nr:hypothetical protein [Chloroflexota bacterium]